MEPESPRAVSPTMLSGTRDEVLKDVAAALSALRKAGRARVDPVAGTVVMRTRWSWKSFGEVVTARIEPAEPGTHVVHVESRPWIRTTLVDYGANAANADEVLEHLTFD